MTEETKDQNLSPSESDSEILTNFSPGEIIELEIINLIKSIKMNITENKTISQESLSNWLCEWLANQLNKSVETINPNQSFVSYSGDSVIAMSLAGDLEEYLGVRLSPTLAWDYDTINDLAQDLAKRDDLCIKKTEDKNLHNSEDILANIDNLSEAEMDSLLASYTA